MAASVRVRVCRVADVPPGTMRSFDVKGHRVLLANVEGAMYAVGGTCPHEGGELSDGDLDGLTVVCPIHFARFSLEDGRVLEGPAEEPVSSFRVKVVDGEIEVVLVE